MTTPLKRAGHGGQMLTLAIYIANQRASLEKPGLFGHLIGIMNQIAKSYCPEGVSAVRDVARILPRLSRCRNSLD